VIVAKRRVGNLLAATPQTVTSAAFLIFVLVVALGGGSARPDVAALMPVRLAAVGLATLVILFAPADRIQRVPIIFMASAGLLVALQLVPLPPALWAALPGRSRYAFDADAGLAAVWRPFSLTPDLTWNTLLSLLPPFAAVLWARVAGQSGRVTALYAIGCIGLSSAVLGLLQLGAGAQTPLRYYAITNNDSAVGLFANRNHNAMFLAITMPPLAIWAGLGGRSVRSEGVIKSWIALSAVVFLLGMAAVTGSRGGLLLAVLSGGLSGLLHWRLRRLWPQSRRGSIMSMAARWLPAGGALVAIALVGLLTQTRVFGRLLATDPLDEQRTQWLKPLSEMAWSFAPVGAGFGSFDSIFRGFEPFDMLQPTYLNAAHNDLLQLAIEGGIGGLALLAVFVIWWTIHSVSAWRRFSGSAADAYACAASVMTGSMLLASLFDYPLRTPLHAVVFAIACVWLSRDEDGSSRRGGQAKTALPLPRD